MSEILSLSNLSKSYDGRIDALSNFNAVISGGECLVLLGPNGAGKTTITSIIATRIRPSSGSVLVDGVDAVSDPAKARGRIAVVPQVSNLDRHLTVLQNLVFHGLYFGLTRSDASRSALSALERLEILDLKSQNVGDLSGGQRQRVMWARALTHSPSLLLLDEPSTGLDVVGRRQTHDLVRSMKKLGVSILLTTHDMDEAEELADSVGVLNKGHLLAMGSPGELIDRLHIGDVLLSIELHDAVDDLEPIRLALRGCETPYIGIGVSGRVSVGLGDDSRTSESDVLSRLLSANLDIVTVARKRVSLEQVFLSAAGEPL